MDIKCKECNLVFADDSSLHRHLKSHKLKTEDYYRKYFPRFDLFSKDPIPFKNKETYLEMDFISKSNLRQWLKKQDIEVAQEYCKDLIKKRIDKKGITFAPTQIEMRSLKNIPAINYYDCIFKGGYYSLCEGLGLKLKFKKNNKKYESIEKEVRFIKCDSREQKMLDFDFPIEVTNLNFGDYCLDDPEKNGNIFIERKSLPDALGTLSKGLERFSNEIERASIANAYIVVLVEETIERALSFNHLPYIYCKMHPDAIFHNVRELLQRYDNIQFLFVNGRKDAAKIGKRILFSKNMAREKDLQLSYDIGEI